MMRLAFLITKRRYSWDREGLGCLGKFAEFIYNLVEFRIVLDGEESEPGWDGVGKDGFNEWLINHS